MHVDVVPPGRRDDTSCHGKAYFWACHSGKFRGCCTEDPCTLGYCPDDEEATTTSKTTTSTSSIGARKSTSPGQPPDDRRPVLILTETETDTDTQTKTGQFQSFIMTDSGTTHTIPSNDRVTITKHTLIVTDKAPSRTPMPKVSSSSTLISTLVPSSRSATVVTTETSSATASSEYDPVGGFSTGAIVGAAVGGVIALAIIAVLMVVFRRRRRRTRRNSQETMSHIRESESGEKAWFEAMSPHTTSTKGSGGDPFAPFGGRVDKADDIHQSTGNTFEMDGTSSVPVELPAEIHHSSDSRFSDPRSSDTATRKHRVQPSGPVDPRANLNASTADRRHNTYVNHWNQYRDLGPAR
ncbi:hypothetical protein B0J13DRAFT_634566 [Dactylonectria estremocensis]|uniref:receptor protein-tyrosine kinase n=1 Tax=Dactylonectria estremocensis TaxID=1079267 RepID=A0A9P9JIY9_9HYPO|nr:hypothetical protein B0J13DRAFT_634566 [Dactylonectria estremocensis]